MPIMVLTARSSIEDKVLAFQSGADDSLLSLFRLRNFWLELERSCGVIRG